MHPPVDPVHAPDPGSAYPVGAQAAADPHYYWSTSPR
jgi:hypothetical protein